MQRSDLFTIKSISIIGCVSVVQTLNTGSMEQSGKDNDDGDDDGCHHQQYCNRLIYIRDNEDGTNMFAPTLSLGNMELFGSELGILMMVIVMVMTMLAVEHH